LFGAVIFGVTSSCGICFRTYAPVVRTDRFASRDFLPHIVRDCRDFLLRSATSPGICLRTYAEVVRTADVRLAIGPRHANIPPPIAQPRSATPPPRPRPLPLHLAGGPGPHMTCAQIGSRKTVRDPRHGSPLPRPRTPTLTTPSTSLRCLASAHLPSPRCRSPLQVRAPHPCGAPRHPDLASGLGPQGLRADQLQEDGSLLLPHHRE
jgi:hypothetical protein